MKKRTVMATIVSVAAPSRNTEKSGFVISYPGMDADDNGVRRFSDNVLESIATNAGFPDAESLLDIIRMSLDKGELQITLENRIAGETWKSDNGETGTYKKDHEAITGIPVFVASEEIAEEIKAVNREILKEKLRGKKEKKRFAPKREILTNPFDAVKTETEEAETEETKENLPF
jgi:hypothetical protein